MSSTASNAIILTVANGINLLINFLTLPFLARVLSYEEYGTYAQLLLLGTLAQIIFGLGIPGVINVFSSQSPEKAKTAYSSANFLILTSALAACFSVLLLYVFDVSIFNNPGFSHKLLLFTPVLFFMIAGYHLSMPLIYYNKVKQMGLVVVATNFLRILLLLAAIYIFESFDAIIYSLLVVYGLQFILKNQILKSKIGYFPIAANGVMIKQIISLSWPLLLTSILGYGVIYLGTIMIGVLLPVKDFAIFRNGAIEIPFVATIFSHVSSAMIPNLARHFNENRIDLVLQAKKKASTLTAAVILPVIFYFILNGEIFIKVYLSSKYAESALIFSLFNIAAIARITSYQDIFTIAKKTKPILIANVISFSLNLLLNILLIRMFGIYGAVFAYLISFYCLIILLVWGSLKLLKVGSDSLFDWNAIFRISLISLVLSAIILLVFRLYENYILVAILSVLYFVGAYKIIFHWKLIELDYFSPILNKMPFLNRVIRKLF